MQEPYRYPPLNSRNNVLPIHLQFGMAAAGLTQLRNGSPAPAGVPLAYHFRTSHFSCALAVTPQTRMMDGIPFGMSAVVSQLELLAK